MRKEWLIAGILFLMTVVLAAAFLFFNSRKEAQPLTPEQIMKIKSVGELAPYLESTSLASRKAAIIRLGQIGKPKDLPLALQTYEQEKLIDSPYQEPEAPGVKEEAVKTIARIGSEEEARDELMKIITDLIRKEGQKQPDGTTNYGNVTYLIIAQAFEDLRRYPGKEVETFCQKIFTDRKITYWPIKMEAAKTKLVLEMNKKRLTAAAKKADFLLTRLTGPLDGPGTWLAGPIGGLKTDEAIRNGAIQNLLVELGKPALPLLENELSKLSPDDPKYTAVTEVIERIKQQP